MSSRDRDAELAVFAERMKDPAERDKFWGKGLSPTQFKKVKQPKDGMSAARRLSGGYGHGW